MLDLLTELMAAAEGRCTYADARWVATDGEDLAVVGGRIDDVAAKPHPPPMRARTPMPSEPVAATSSMRPPTTAKSSPSVATQRASA